MSQWLFLASKKACITTEVSSQTLKAVQFQNGDANIGLDPDILKDNNGEMNCYKSAPDLEKDEAEQLKSILKSDG